MAAEERQSYPAIIERLFRECFVFSFFQAAHLLESLSPKKKPLGQTLVPGEEPVRFHVKPGLIFPPSEIANVRPSDDQGPIDMDVTFMGLIGPSGALPQWYNELGIERARQKDFAFSAFLDIFHHRLISLFYLAWKKHQFPASYLKGGKDKVSSYLLSLMGLGTEGLVDRIGLPVESLLFHCGLLSRIIPSGSAIAATLEYFSGVQVEVRQFVERLIPLSREDQTQLGTANGEVGVDAICGSVAWDCQSKFQILLGPMKYKAFQDFLPDGVMLGCVFSLVKYMAGIEYEFEVCLLLEPDEVPVCVLDREAVPGPRLGWSTWVKSKKFVHDEAPWVKFITANP